MMWFKFYRSYRRHRYSVWKSLKMATYVCLLISGRGSDSPFTPSDKLDDDRPTPLTSEQIQYIEENMDKSAGEIALTLNVRYTQVEYRQQKVKRRARLTQSSAI